MTCLFINNILLNFNRCLQFVLLFIQLQLYTQKKAGILCLVPRLVQRKNDSNRKRLSLDSFYLRYLYLFILFQEDSHKR
jgi:hypothetical protein